MAVVAVWKCDRDGSMFANKKDAEEHDKMLELAENISALIEKNISGIDDKQSEAIGLLLAKRREDLAKACKGKPEALTVESEADLTSNETNSDENTVTPISAGASA